MKTIRYTCVTSVLLTGLLIGLGESPALAPPTELYVNPLKGRDRNRGSKASPVKTISAALAKVPDPVTESVTIFVLPGDCMTTGGKEMSDTSLELMRRMRPGVSVTFKGEKDRPPLFGWAKQAPVVIVTEGHWGFENLKIGAGSLAEPLGIIVEGAAVATVENCKFRLRSESGAAIIARRGGVIRLRGAIEINEDLHATEKVSSFSGILAEDGGLVEFSAGEDSRLDIGNGGLRSQRYGIIRLACEVAKITSWSKQSSILSIRNGGRIDLHDTTLTLRAHHASNTPVAIADGGQVLARGSRIVIGGKNDAAIKLQTRSAFICDEVDLRGKFGLSVGASSGAMFAGSFVSDVTKLDAQTGAEIHVLKLAEGKTVGEATALSGGLISLPDVTIRSK